MCHYKTVSTVSQTLTPMPTVGHALNCTICGQPVVGEPQQTWRGETFYIYTCRNIHCEAGVREITLDAQQFNALTIDIVRTFPMPRTAAMKLAGAK